MTGKDMAGAVIAAIGRALAPVLRSVGSLGDRLASLEKRVSELPAPEKGETGERGERGERGEKGEKGDPGEPGPKGQDGAPGIPGEKGATGERGEVGDTGRDGRDGQPGERGERGPKGDTGMAGEKGASGEPGADGLSPTPEAVAKAMEPLFSTWALEFERRAQEHFQRAIDRMPAPKDGKDGANGKDGKDALELKHFSASLDGRILRLSLKNDEREETADIPLPIVIDREVYRDSETYAQGDGVTYAGSYWIARKDAPEGKPGTSSDWRLAVKKGRDGRDGRDGIDKTVPVKVTPK